MPRFYTTHRPVRFPSGVAMNEKLTRRFGVNVPVGSRFLGIDNDSLRFVCPDVHPAETETFRFLSAREYATIDVKDIDTLEYVGRVKVEVLRGYGGEVDVWQEVDDVD